MRKTNKTSKNRKGGDWFSWPSSTCVKRNWFGQCIDVENLQTPAITSSSYTQDVQGSVYNPSTVPMAPSAHTVSDVPVVPVVPVAPVAPTNNLYGGKRTKKNNRRKKTNSKRGIFGSVLKMFTCNKHSRKNKNKKGGSGYKPLYLQPFADANGNQLLPYQAHTNLVGGNVQPYSRVDLEMDQQANFNPNGKSYMVAGKHKMKRMPRSKKSKT